MNAISFSNVILAAAALAVSVTAAMAQVQPTRLVATIPFSFHAGGHDYPAGDYEAGIITSASGTKALKIVNSATRKPAMVQVQNLNYTPTAVSANDDPRIGFACSDSGCSLSHVWVGSGQPGLQFRVPSPVKREATKLTMIRLLPTAAD